MANIIATNEDSYISLNSQDNLYVPDAVTMINTNGSVLVDAFATAFSSSASTTAISAFFSSNVFVDGDVISMSGIAIFAGSDNFTNGFNNINIGTTGKVRSLETAAIDILGSFNDVTNLGDVYGAAWGFVLRDGTGNAVENHGQLQSDSFGIFATNNTSFSVTNTGLISADAPINAADSAGQIVNDGTIIVNTINGTAIETEDATGAIDLTNTGKIIAPNNAVQFGSEANEISNSGTISGRVSTNGGMDVVRNSGQIDGELNLGGGADTYSGAGGGLVTRSILGGAGADLIQGSRFGDNIRGDEGADEIDGFGGDDVLRGGSENDILRGGGGEDAVAGGLGDDRLNGGSGNDVMNGGAGKDIQTGGAGADVFIFVAVTDSLNGATRDRIRDFELGQDKIDLSSIDDFTYLGSGPFNASGDAEVRVVVRNGTSQVDVDADGNGTAEMRISLLATDGLVESDFLL